MFAPHEQGSRLGHESDTKGEGQDGDRIVDAQGDHVVRPQRIATLAQGKREGRLPGPRDRTERRHSRGPEDRARVQHLAATHLQHHGDDHPQIDVLHKLRSGTAEQHDRDAVAVVLSEVEGSDARDLHHVPAVGAVPIRAHTPVLIGPDAGFKRGEIRQRRRSRISLAHYSQPRYSARR